MNTAYQLKDLHLNSHGVLQVNPEECFEDFEEWKAKIEQTCMAGTEHERMMWQVFSALAEPVCVYRDNDVNQGRTGPRRVHIAGRPKLWNDDYSLTLRVGIKAPGENPLITAFQALYSQTHSHLKYLMGSPVGVEECSDQWSYEFTDRYKGITETSDLRTQRGIQSLSIINALNEALLKNTSQLETLLGIPPII
jgi:hypothetical protein